MRTKENGISPILPFLYEVLLIVENDEKDYRKGYNWVFVKNRITKSKVSDETKGISKIISFSNDCSLTLVKGGSLASKFLKCIRNAFAHNRVKYDENTGILEFESDGKKTKYLYGTVTEEALKEIVFLIKESKIQKEQCNNK